MNPKKFLNSAACLHLVLYLSTLYIAITGGAGQPTTFTTQQDTGITFFSFRAHLALVELLGIYCIYLAFFGFGNNESLKAGAFIPWESSRYRGILGRALSMFALACGAFLMVLPLAWWNQIEEGRELLQLLDKYNP